VTFDHLADDPVGRFETFDYFAVDSAVLLEIFGSPEVGPVAVDLATFEFLPAESTRVRNPVVRRWTEEVSNLEVG